MRDTGSEGCQLVDRTSLYGCSVTGAALVQAKMVRGKDVPGTPDRSNGRKARQSSLLGGGGGRQEEVGIHPGGESPGDNTRKQHTESYIHGSWY